MNIKELTYLLQNPSELKEGQTENLEKLIKEFPYFQSVRSLILKGLKDQGSFRYNQELKTTAAYTSDRSVLFDFITSSLFNKNTEEHLADKKKNTEISVIDPEEVKTLPRISMDDAIAMRIEEAENVLDPTLFSSKEDSDFRHITIAENLIKQSEKNNPTEKKEEEKPVEKNNPDKKEITAKTNIEEELEINKPFDFSKKETHSFAEWLKLSTIQPIDRSNEKPLKPEEKDQKKIKKEKKEDKTPSKSKSKFDLIDDFIANNPKIKPAPKNAASRNLAKEHVAPDELMTETLARVYLAQKNYKKAIQAYKILILKNPEKSGFFADQIRTIKKLHENK